MRRTILFLSLVAMLVVAAFPVIAQDRNDRGDRFDNGGFFSNGNNDSNDRGDRFDNGGFFSNGNNDNDFNGNGFSFSNDDDDDDFERNGFFFSGDDFDNDFAFDDGVVDQSIGQESESGDVSLEFSVESSGDFAQQCVAPLQFGNTGNLQNAQGFAQYNSDSDDIEFEGNSFEFSPEVAVSCDQAVQQSAAASG